MLCPVTFDTESTDSEVKKIHESVLWQCLYSKSTPIRVNSTPSKEPTQSVISSDCRKKPSLIK